MYLIETESLSCKQGTKYLVRDINWNVAEKENWIVFGMNGCGKTTLLSIVAGYRKFTHGTVKVFGENLTNENAVRLRQRISFLSGSYFDNIFSHEGALTIVLGGLFGNLSERYEINDYDVKKAKQLLTALGLKSRASYPYDMLSKGQRQKVLIARALIAKPELLILDEPCTGLDIFAREYFLNTIYDITKELNTSLIYVTHHSDEILPIFNKAMLMKNAKIHSQGDLHDIFNNDNLSDFFDYDTKVEWIQNKMQFKIAEGLKMNKNIWNMNNEKTYM